jgi:hypothetical protein
MARRRFGTVRHTPASVGELLKLPGVRVLAIGELAWLVVVGVLAVR